MQTATLNKPKTGFQGFSDADTCVRQIVSAVEKALLKTQPYRHWLIQDLLPVDVSEAILVLPITPSSVMETYGKRDSHNDVRRFFSPESRQKYPVMQVVAEAFQSPVVARAIEKLCGAQLKNSFLRIEYCQDKMGFWLEPHMDIKEKHITLQFYLNTGAGADKLGTDIYDHNKKFFSSAPSALGNAMLFVPKEPESWHGFEKRPIPDVRRSLIINYVTDDWRSVHELSFPEQKVS